MSKNFAVSIIDFHSNEMTIHKVSACDWKHALADSCKEREIQMGSEESDTDYINWVMSVPDDMAEAKEEFFDGDMMFAVVEI